jgi:hypothetical protein
MGRYFEFNQTFPGNKSALYWLFGSFAEAMNLNSMFSKFLSLK